MWWNSGQNLRQRHVHKVGSIHATQSSHAMASAASVDLQILLERLLRQSMILALVGTCVQWGVVSITMDPCCEAHFAAFAHELSA